MWSLNANRSTLPLGQPSADFGFGIQIVGLVPQVETGIRR